MSGYGSGQGEDEAAWNASASRSVDDPAQSEQVQTFCSVTGADADTAVHVLEAHNWDMDRSVMFFLEGGAPAQPTTAAHPSARLEYQAAQAPIVVDEDSPPVASRQPAFPASAVASAPPSEQDLLDMDQDERDLQQALQASMHSQDTAQTRGGPDQGEDDEGAALGRMLASHNQNMQHQSRPLDDEASFAGMQQGFLDRGSSAAQRQQNRRGTAPRDIRDSALEAIGRSIGIGMPTALPPLRPHTSPDAAVQAASAVQQPGAMGHADFGSQANGDIDMPSDINVEEARMLEAAMLGIPYEGTIPDFAAQPARPRVPPSASSMAGQSVRQEQDWAYEQSLQADRDKREAAEHAAREKTEAAEAAARQLADEQAAASAKEANMKQALQSKQQGLPSEPGAGEADVVQVAVRMPNGSRFTRRFRCTDKLSHLFDAIDIHTEGKELRPGSYRLVAQYPRRVFTDGTPGSLRDVGLAQSKQETVLVETID